MIKISELPAASALGGTEVVAGVQGGVTAKILISAIGTYVRGLFTTTPATIAEGGTGAASAGAARTALGLAIGTDVQAYDADIPTVAASQGEMEAGTEAALRSMSPLRVAQAIAALVAVPAPVPVRQTVLSGPVDSAGLAAFVGATGATTVTATGTLKASAAAGGNANYTGSITNPSWTGLSTDGTVYLFLDITSAGVVTTGSTTLVPVYQWGGTYSTTNGQNTFNIQEMTMKVGDGAAATQVYRVFVGEVTVAGNVVTAITWYALMGRYWGADTATLPGSAVQVSKSHNIGTFPLVAELFIRCTTIDAGFAVGDVIKPFGQGAAAADFDTMNLLVSRLTVGMTTPDNAASFGARNKTTGVRTGLTAASWSYFLTANRGW